MHLYTRPCAVSLVFGLAALGCMGAAPPTAPLAPSSAGPLPELAGYGLLGGYTLTLGGLDSASPYATAEPWRVVQDTDDITHLSIQNFLKPAQLIIEGVSLTGTSVDLRYSIDHPFAAPIDLTGPFNGQTNRADLGFTGKLVILAELPTGSPPSDYTFFSGAVTANTDIVLNADGYVQPRGLLPQAAALTADTFPYKLVVDETLGAEGNRHDRSAGVAIGNGGDPEGNYDPAIDGWGRANIGPDNNGWTGFDYLHQGQAGRNVLSLDRTLLATSAFQFDAVVIAQYATPAYGASPAIKRANRLAPPINDASQWAYRMPHGALDGGVVRYEGELGGLAPGDNGSSSFVRLTVRDWDARGTATGSADLGIDQDVTTVYPFEVGIPTLEVDIPGVTASPQSIPLADNDGPIGGDPGPDSGLPGDELYFTGPVINNGGGPGQGAGTYLGLAQVTDPANDDLRTAYEAFLAPDLTPITADLPELVTFGALTVALAASGCTPQTQNWSFDGSDQGWRSGATIGLRNGDPAGFGAFQWACHSDPAAQLAVTASGGLLSGEFLLSSADDGGCEFIDDYGADADYNILSPVVVVPSGICGPLSLTFNAVAWAQASAFSRAYVSLDGGATWGAPLWELAGTNALQSNSINLTVSGAQSGDELQVRFQFRDSGGAIYQGANGYAGLFIDQVALTVDATGNWVPAPGGAVLWSEDFESGAPGWGLGALTNADGMAACGFGLWGSFAACDLITDVVPVVGLAASASPDDGACGGTGQGDLGASANYNFVSPAIDLSGASTPLTLQWDALRSLSAGGVTLNVYLSTDNGASWGAPINVQTWAAPQATAVEADSADLSAAAGSATVRLRLQVTTPAPISSPPPADPNFCDYSVPGDFTQAQQAATDYLADPIAVDNLKIVQG